MEAETVCVCSKGKAWDGRSVRTDQIGAGRVVKLRHWVRGWGRRRRRGRRAGFIIVVFDGC